jgi:hypothetical protein
MFVVYLLVSSPSSLSVDHDTNIVPEADTSPESDYTVDDPSLAAKLPSKHPPPLEHANIAYSFSLMLALEIAIVTAFLYRMHSLFL